MLSTAASVTSRAQYLAEDALCGLRAQFPLLQREVNGKPVAFLDSAASAQKVQAALDAESALYTRSYANIHRAVHTLSQEATTAYENARETAARFLGAPSAKECVFVRGATEAVNLVAQSYARPRLQPGDTILLTGMEHHANIVPWQLVAQQTGAQVIPAAITPEGEIDRADFAAKLAEHAPKIVAFVHISNSLGTINPAKEMVAEAHAAGAVVLLDLAQSAPHVPLDVVELDCDFGVFSGHKVFAPNGIGVLFGKMALLEEMEPYQGGGDMIERVAWSGTTFKGPPERFEAGTPHIAGAVGLAAALQWLMAQDRSAILAHEDALRAETEARLLDVPGLRIIGTASKKASVVSFVLDGTHPHDVGTFLDLEGIAVRTGHHCCQPLMTELGLPGTTRASFAFYNTAEEVERLAKAVHKVAKFFA